MAIGDDAVAAGIDLTPGNGQASDLDMYINRLADEVARRTRFTSASTAAAIRNALGISGSNTPTTTSNVQADLDYLSGQLVAKLTKTPAQYNADLAYRDSLISTAQNTGNSAQGTANDAIGRSTAALQGNLYTDSYNRSLSGTRRTAWLQDNGQLGYAASSERYKKLIRPEDVTDDQVLQLVLVSYQWRAAVAVDDRREMGLIAERLVEAGLGWACFYGENGVEGINYEMVGIALLPAVQRLIARTHQINEDLDVCSQRIAALEGRSA